MTGTTVFGCLPGAHPYWAQKSFKINNSQNQNFGFGLKIMTGTSVLGCLPGAYWAQKSFKIDWIREKTPGQSCQSGYLLLWWLWCTIGGLGTLRKCYVSSPVAKALVLDWKSWLAHNCFWMSSWGSPLLGPKKLQNQQFYIIDWIRKKTPGQSCQSGYLLPWWLWCTIGGFGKPARMLC